MSTSHVNGQAGGLVAAELSRNEVSCEPIAVVGIGCRFPGGANGPRAFWDILASGTDAITLVPEERWNQRAFYDQDRTKPGKTYTRWGGFVEGIDRFDAPFFGISPREAARMDPQQRLLLEVAWEGLEDAGLSLEGLSGSKTAVFVGISNFDYAVQMTGFRDRGDLDVYSNTGGSLSIAANRISYCFDFRGPSVAVDTACSSALVAVHLACQSIWRDRCPLALAGGVNALLLPDWYVGFCRMGMLSPDGRCRAFDAHASGFVRSEGAGVVVLKPLAHALADGDRIYAAIAGSAVNQDGRTQGMTMPSQEAQEAVIRQACSAAGVMPATLQYVEAHGTGTLVGDPIEARALGRVIGSGRPRGEPCLIGSVKTNIGHLEAGAGIAGLIKTALALYQRRIPANLHFSEPNPEIDFDGLGLRVPTRCQPWPTCGGPLLAGVNSFGFGGTNAHVVMRALERRRNAATAVTTGSEPVTDAGAACLIPVSARSAEALLAQERSWHEFLTACPQEIAPAEIAANAGLRRTHHEHRLAVVAESRRELAEALADCAAGRSSARAALGRAREGHRPRIAFVCSGQGPQWWAMGRELLHQEPVFRSVIERCDAIMRELGAWSLIEELGRGESASRMEATSIAQPCLFALQVGLAALWASWGVTPAALVGHSVGEVAAAFLAGGLGLEDAVRIIYERGRCMELAPARGGMLAAALSPDEAERLIAEYGQHVCLAAVNSPGSVTISGELEPLQEIAQRLSQREVFHRFLRVEYAFHSALMDPIRDELTAALVGIQPRAAGLPLVSTVSGRLAPGPHLDPEYWWQNVRRTVQFAAGIERVIELECDAVVELGPHPVLASAVSECYAQRGKRAAVLPSLRRGCAERVTMLRSLGELYTLGCPIDWGTLTAGARRFIDLPLYPWQRERYWQEAEDARQSRVTPPAHPLLGFPQHGPRPAWEVRLDLRLAPYLADHRVQHATVLPATAYLELAFAAAREALGAAACELTGVKLSSPCFLVPEKAYWLHTSFVSETATVQVHTRPHQGGPDWTAHVVASVSSVPVAAGKDAVSVQAIRQRCPRELSHDELYEHLREVGLTYGPLFQGIECAWQGERESLGLIRLPDSLRQEAAEYIFHPALLDACLQVVVAADDAFRREAGALYLPHEIDLVRLVGRPGPCVWSHARLIEKTPQRYIADVDVYDEDGQLAACVRGMLCQRVAAGREELLDDLLYLQEWQLQERRERESAAAGGRWLLFADSQGVAARLAAKLRARGDHCMLAYAASAFENLGDGQFRCAADRPEEIGRLVEAFVRPSDTPYRGIVHLWNLDAPAEAELALEALEAWHATGLLSVVHLLRGWENVVRDQSGTLFLVTRGAQSVGDLPEVTALAQSSAVGLGRVIAGEYAGLRCKLIDLDRAADGNETLLFEEIQAADPADEVAFRGTSRFVPRYVNARGRSEGRRRSTEPSGAPYRLTIQQPGTLDALALQSVRRAPPGPGEVEIEVCAAGLNFSDVMKALGMYPGLADGRAPLGAECSGHVTALGAGVNTLSLGDEVVAVARHAFGRFVVTRAELVAPKPGSISFEAAATLPIAFLTASYALEHLGRIQAGESVLIHSASGGVGLAALQLARRAGATVLATAGTSEKRDYLRALGVKTVMDSRALDFAHEVRERTAGRGVDLVLNSLPGEAIPRGLSALADHGRFLEIGKRDIYGNARLGLEPFRKNLSFFAIDLDRVISERPALLRSLLQEIVRRVAEGELEPLPHCAWPIQEFVGAFRQMQQGKHIGKIVLSISGEPLAALPAEAEPVRFCSDASYLITGGLGGFGGAVARWMVERGARRLVLLGRRGADTPEAAQCVAELEEAGARVLVRAADVSRRDDLASVLADMERDLPPLRGVVHAAMVIEDRLLTDLDRQCVERVLAPKVLGAWNLHAQTAGHPLDFFVLFSSLSSVFGSSGQGNYAAANAFLDALAWHRRALGMPGVSINWGHIGEVGYIARRPELGERLERQGVLSIRIREALALLEKAMQQQFVQVGALRMDWSRWRGPGVTGRPTSRFAGLCSAGLAERPTLALANGQPGDRACSVHRTILAIDPEERSAFLTGMVRDKVAHVLGISPDRLETDRPLLRLGIDSLMAVELRNWLEGELHVNLPIVELLRSPSLNGLCEILLDRLGTSDQPAAREAAGSGRCPMREPADSLSSAACVPRELLARVEELPGEEVDALLAALLKEKTP
jgi:acyl transferase domain-containing protein/NADPH:quinone reductase-like Zn-dependent oxidoreductase/acyl carrier protein